MNARVLTMPDRGGAVGNLRPSPRPFDWLTDDETNVAVQLVLTPYEVQLMVSYLEHPGATALVQALGAKIHGQVQP